MASILIAYDTTEGQTRKIAQRVADVITRAGGLIELHDLQKLPPSLSLAKFAGVVLGASIHMGKHSPRLAGFLRQHKAELAARRAGFFSVSLQAAGAEKDRSDATRYVDELLRQVGWQPDLRATFAGGLMYRDYSVFKRWMIAKIAKDAGMNTDTSQNHEYTDWQAVERFALEFLAGLEAPRATPAEEGRR